MTNDDKMFKVLDELSTNIATVLAEQQAQRTDIRSLQREVSSLKIGIETVKTELTIKIETVKTELITKIEAVKTELEEDIETTKLEVKSEIARTSKNHNTRLANLEEHVGISDPTKH